MRPLRLRVILFFCLLMFSQLLLIQLPSVHAQEPELKPSVLTISPIIEATVGKRIKVDLQLANLEGRAIPNAPLTITLNEQYNRRVRTDDEGKVDLSLTWDLPVGEYPLEVHYRGSFFYQGILVTPILKINPAQVQVKIVPPLEGMPLVLIKKPVEGEAIFEQPLRAVSDAEGYVLFSLDVPGTYDLDILFEEYQTPIEEMQIAFERWGDNSFGLEREIMVPQMTYLEAGFEVSYMVGQTFTDLSNEAISEERIEHFTVKSSHGTTHHFENGEKRILQASRVVKRRTGLEVSPIQYSIEAVSVDGSNVVNRAQQRFFITKPDIWTIQLLLYSGYFEARDGLFGVPIGTGIELTYPDGRVEFVEFDENGSVKLLNVARGLYKVQVVLDENDWKTIRGIGMAPLTPVALSRNQDVQLLVISFLDMMLAITSGLIVALGLLYYGRPQWFRLPLPWFIHTVPQAVINPGLTMPKNPITQRMYFGSTRLLVKLVESKKKVESSFAHPSTTTNSINSQISKDSYLPNSMIEPEIGD